MRETEVRSALLGQFQSWYPLATPAEVESAVNEAMKGYRPGPTCPHCGSEDVTEPYEMDGYRDGVYHVRGLWWLFCRACTRHARAEAPDG